MTISREYQFKRQMITQTPEKEIIIALLQGIVTFCDLLLNVQKRILIKKFTACLVSLYGIVRKLRYVKISCN